MSNEQRDLILLAIIAWPVLYGLFYRPWSDRRYRIKHGMLGVWNV